MNNLYTSRPFKVPYTDSQELRVSGPKEAVRTGIYPVPLSSLAHRGVMVCLYFCHAGTVINKFFLLP